MTKYPIELTVERLKTERGLDITALYGNRAQAFLSDVHVAVYEGCIYATGAREIKDRIINGHLKDTEHAILLALCLQAEYTHETGHVGTESGITITADGQKAVVSKDELRSKNVCVAAVDALKACACPILYAGERVK
ncbi:MAG: hypothetical protein IJB34_04410 [Clostridia bacterium]|nr:hypothetical protein [Clostridia bacterium]